MTTRKGPKKWGSPSQRRYDAENPVVAIRTSKQIHAQLSELRQTTGKSWADMVLGEVGPALASIEADFKPKLQDAYQRGWDAAKEKYSLTFPCHVCGKPLTVDDPESKQLVGKALQLTKRFCCEQCYAR